MASDTRADDLEDSISSIAQRVVEQKEGKKSENSKVDIVALTKQLVYNESAEQDEKEKEEAEDKKEKAEEEKQAEEELDNPISTYFADKHPEVLKAAKERHYLTDQV